MCVTYGGVSLRSCEPGKGCGILESLRLHDGASNQPVTFGEVAKHADELSTCTTYLSEKSASASRCELCIVFVSIAVPSSAVDITLDKRLKLLPSRSPRSLYDIDNSIRLHSEACMWIKISSVL